MNQREIKKNELKEMRTISETSETMLKHNIRIIGIQEEDKKKDHEKILEEIIVENFPKMGEGNNHPSPGNPEIPKQDKPKMKQPKTHINQINKDKT